MYRSLYEPAIPTHHLPPPRIDPTLAPAEVVFFQGGLLENGFRFFARSPRFFLFPIEAVFFLITKFFFFKKPSEKTIPPGKLGSPNQTQKPRP